jgi:hypothetical protein
MARGAASAVGSLVGLVWLLAAGLSADPQSSQRPSSAARSSAGPSLEFVEQYCVRCHNSQLKTGGLALDTSELARVAEHGEVWEKVIRKLRGGAMPPDGAPRPAAAAAAAFVASLENALDTAYAKAPNPGRTETFHRLNRAEYHNAIRDLLDLDIDVTELLPADDVSYGFDNIAGVLGISPALLDRYTTAAQKISRIAVGSLSIPPTANSFRVPSDQPQDGQVDGLPLGTRGGVLVNYHFPVDAQYAFRVKLARNYTDTLAPIYENHDLELTLDGERLKVFSIVPTGGRGRAARGDVDGDFEVRLPVKAGPRQVVATFIKKTMALTEGQRVPPIRPAIGAGGDTRPQPYLGSLTISGPFEPTGPGDPPSRRRIFTCSGGDACARRILSALARRAYRRPVTEADLAPLVEFYEQGKADGGAGSFDAGIELALRRLLVSPSFLLRIERDPPGIAPNTAYRLSDVELASRLSFLLWSTIPDEPLLEAATQGRLRDRTVLEAQVRRMLADPRSRALITNFAGQWLYLRNLNAFRPDEELFPDFDDGLRQAFRQETELFFESVLRENRSVLELLTADYTFVNERLARHYGIPNIYGSQFRRVALTGNRRRGLIGHGSILAVTSFPTRTSPVLRGKWVLDNLLGFPPPEPPAVVPALKENTEGTAAMSVRQRLEAHRSNPGCASCHKIMDPLGFALENFDAVGGWRDRGEDDVPIDSTGALLDGTRVDGPASLREALLRQPENFVRTLAEKLMTYGLGRGVEYYDQPAIRQIVKQAGGARATLPGLIIGIVSSPPFQSRRSAS